MAALTMCQRTDLDFMGYWRRHRAARRRISWELAQGSAIGRARLAMSLANGMIKSPKTCQ